MSKKVYTAQQYREMIAQPEKYSKFGNEWCEVDGIKFQSKAEAKYYGRLQMRLRAKDIKRFERQILYRIVINGFFICSYRVDFIVYHNDGTKELIDVKSEGTESLYVFLIKKNLMLACFGLTVNIAK